MLKRSVAIFLFLTALPGAGFAQEPKLGESLAGSLPGGAIAYFETVGLAELIRQVGESEVFQSVLASEDFERLKETKVFQEAMSARKYVEFVLRMSIWEASDKLLGGRFAIAAYPAGEGEDPHVVVLMRPSQPSDWLKRRVRFAPLVRLGVKRIGRGDYGDHVSAYRTRGDEEDATYFGLHDGWIAVSTKPELLEGTVALQEPGDIEFDRPDPLRGEASFVRMTKRMGEKHLARAFIDSQRLGDATGANLGLPKEIGDPILSLFLGGVVELMDSSRFVGFTLDYDEKHVLFRSGIDARPEDVPQEYRLFFSGSTESGITALPEVPGYIGGFSLYRPFSTWYRNRDASVKGTLIPGMEGFEGKVGDLLLGSDSKGRGLVGDRIAFVAAQADDAGADPAGIHLPGFAFVIDIAEAEGADAGLRELFDATLEEIEIEGKKGDALGWEVETAMEDGVQVMFANHRPVPKIPPLVPAAARVGGHFIISSSRKLCGSLIDYLRDDGPGSIASKDLAFELDFPELSKFFAANREAYIAEFVRAGRTPEQAAKDYVNLTKMLAAMQSLRGESSSAGGIFEFEARGEFR